MTEQEEGKAKNMEILNRLKAVRWDWRNGVRPDDVRLLDALDLPVLPWGEFETPEEQRLGVTLRRTGAGNVIASDLQSGLEGKGETARQALGVIRANLGAARALGWIDERT